MARLVAGWLFTEHRRVYSVQKATTMLQARHARSIQWLPRPTPMAKRRDSAMLTPLNMACAQRQRFLFLCRVLPKTSKKMDKNCLLGEFYFMILDHTIINLHPRTYLAIEEFCRPWYFSHISIFTDKWITIFLNY